MTDRDNEPIFWVGNHHAASCGKPPHIDGDIRKRYHGYFENELHEQFIFVYDYEVGESTLWCGDAGWERSYKVENARPENLLLSENEALWLYNCWIMATGKKPMWSK